MESSGDPAPDLLTLSPPLRLRPPTTLIAPNRKGCPSYSSVKRTVWAADPAANFVGDFPPCAQRARNLRESGRRRAAAGQFRQGNVQLLLGTLRADVYDNAVRVDSAAPALAAAIKILKPMQLGHPMH